MSAISTLGQRQQALLQFLLANRQGLTVDELARELEISRNAVNQHLSSLEGSGFVENTAMSRSGGRPSKLYALSLKGLELFPKHYALFSKLLIHWIQEKLDDDELRTCMADIGIQIGHDVKPRVDKQSTLAAKIAEVANIMQELGYEAHINTDENGIPEIVASNCVFHQLATDCDDVCHLDLTLISFLLDSPIEHRECMVKDGQCCRFGVNTK